MYEFLQISQVLDPALCWTPRYPHNPVGPRGGPYRNQCSPQKLVQSAKEPVQPGNRHDWSYELPPCPRGKGRPCLAEESEQACCLPVLAERCRDATDLAPRIPGSAPGVQKGVFSTAEACLLRLPRPGIQEGARGPGTTVSHRYLPLPMSWVALLFGDIAGHFAAAYVNQAIPIHSECVSRYKI